jgi:hypothetical protein
MEVNLSELERVEAILEELKGNEAAHGNAGMLQIDRTNLELSVEDVGGFEEGLPDVLKSVVNRLQELASGNDDEAPVARTALYHLYRSIREASQ